MAISFASGFTPILSLKKSKPSFCLRCASATSSSAVLLPSSHIGFTPLRRGRATRSISRCAGGAADQIEHRHLDRRMRAAVAEQRAMQRRAQRRPVAGILADQHRREMIAHRGDEPALRVAGHGRRGGGFAPADGAVRRFDAHEQILRGRDGLGRHLHRRLQRQRHRDRIDAADGQRRLMLPLRRRRFFEHRAAFLSQHCAEPPRDACSHSKTAESPRQAIEAGPPRLA